ncbi:MAG: hypothetical protein O7H39_04190, partial [Gammaproteobacteria bacterium]|nr:hypothetical protein [Gammaproteobacteria bacterium]
MTRSTQVAVVQMCATSDIEHNLSSSAPLVQGAADAGAEVVLLPEAFTYIGSNKGKAEALEPLPQGGPILDRCRAMARDANVHLIFGFHEARQKDARQREAADEGDARSFNTCVHLNPAGEIESCYRKIHMFDVDLSDGTRLLESRGTAPGDTPVTTE